MRVCGRFARPATFAPCPTSALNVDGLAFGGLLKLGLERVETADHPGVGAASAASREAGRIRTIR